MHDFLAILGEICPDPVCLRHPRRGSAGADKNLFFLDNCVGSGQMLNFVNPGIRDDLFRKKGGKHNKQKFESKENKNYLGAKEPEDCAVH